MTKKSVPPEPELNYPTAEIRKTPTRPPGWKAPFVIYGAMFSIALVGIIVIFISHCASDRKYMDPSPPGSAPMR